MGLGKANWDLYSLFLFLQQRHEARVRFSLSGCGSSRGILLFRGGVVHSIDFNKDEFLTALLL